MGPPGPLRHWADEPHYDKQIRGGEMRGKEKRNGSRMVRAPWKDTGRNEGGEGWADIGSLLATHVDVWAKLLPRVMSGSPILQ